MIFLIWLGKFADVLPAFTRGRTIGNLLSICLRFNILRLEWLETFSEKRVCSIFIENILLSNGITNSFSTFKKII